MNCVKFKSSRYAECDNRSIIVCKENGKKYVLENSFKEEICKIKIDKGYISLNVELCDYLVVICAKNIAIFVELKGVEFEKACSQLLSTIQLFISDIKRSGCIVLGRIVGRTIPDIPGTNQRKLKKFLKKLNKNKAIKCKGFDKKSKEFKEKVSKIIA